MTGILQGPGIDEPIARGGTYLVQDHLGSTTALVNGGGSQVGSYRYSPFGGVTTATGSSAAGNPYRFTGRDDDGTGLYYLRARYYAPQWGRFISEDPIGFAGGINQYAYAGNRPLNNTDPSGLTYSQVKSPLGEALALLDEAGKLYKDATEWELPQPDKTWGEAIGDALDDGWKWLTDWEDWKRHFEAFGNDLSQSLRDIFSIDPPYSIGGINLSNNEKDIVRAIMKEGNRSRGEARELIHTLKRDAEMGARDDIWLDRDTGDLFRKEGDAWEHIGHVTDPPR